MKPRLKLHLDGQVTVISRGESGLSRRDVKALLRRHYGGLRGAATRLGLPLWALTEALNSDRHTRWAGGQIARCRQIFGLPSWPGERARLLAESNENVRQFLDSRRAAA